MSDELTSQEWITQPVRIEKNAVYFGDTKVPGCIASDGVTFRAGDAGNVNRLTIEFFVGALTADDPLAQQKTAFDRHGFKVTGE